jgi:hypothetical protein
MEKCITKLAFIPELPNFSITLKNHIFVNYKCERCGLEIDRKFEEHILDKNVATIANIKSSKSS